MWKYYLKIAWRNFRTNKLFSVLNLLGLSIGIAICIPLFLFVQHELSFDRMHLQKDDIYRVNLHTLGTSGSTAGETWACVPNAVAPAVLKDIPEVRYAARMLKNGFGVPASLKIGNENFKEDKLYWCDPSVFKIFKFDFIAGGASEPLRDVNDVVISASESKRLFGGKNPIGQVITVDNNQQLIVKAVYKDLPENSTIDCGLIANFQATRLSKNIYWSNASYETYCLLEKGADWKQVQRKLGQLVTESVDAKDRWFTLSLQPFSRVHLYSKDILSSYSSRAGDIKTVLNLSFLGLLILIIACINYMNLATARSERRSKEVGINKTLGASRKNMLWRFYMDTALIAFGAILFGFLLSFGSISFFNYVTGNHLLISTLFTWSTLGCLILLWLIITLLAGSYPAILLSGSSALQLMRQKMKVGGLDKVLRKSLVVLQFSCSVILIIAVVIIYRQMKFVSKKDLGFQPHGVISVGLSGLRSMQQFVTLRNELLAVPDIEDAATVQAPPGFATSQRSIHRNSDAHDQPLYTNNADSHIVKTLGLKLIAGRNLPTQINKGDSTCYLLVNKKVVEYLGFTPEQAIGKKIQVDLGDNAVVVGVVDDFNYASLKKPIGAYLYYSSNDAPEAAGVMLIRLNTTHLAATMDKVQRIFKRNVPDVAFDYQFLDAHLASLYLADKVVEKSAILFSSLAIFVSCLGLFGLSAFMAEQRTKEVGIRKVLGASVFNIARLLSTDFLKLVCLAIAIGIPVAIWLMHGWLQHFEYRIGISWTVVTFAALLALFIALLTVSLQSVKTALS
ncbi:MAG TPA: ABC transporter permease, partial [Arachidicoccus sp.]|nr:ABC transporter permease [Arachidicoccus sp.]